MKLQKEKAEQMIETQKNENAKQELQQENKKLRELYSYLQGPSERDAHTVLKMIRSSSDPIDVLHSVLALNLIPATAIARANSPKDTCTFDNPTNTQHYSSAPKNSTPQPSSYLSLIELAG